MRNVDAAEMNMGIGEQAEVVVYNESMTRCFDAILGREDKGYVLKARGGNTIVSATLSGIPAISKGLVFLTDNDGRRESKELPKRMAIDHAICITICEGEQVELDHSGNNMKKTLESIGLSGVQYAEDYVDRHRAFFERDNVEMYRKYDKGLITKEILVDNMVNVYKLWELVEINYER